MDSKNQRVKWYKNQLSPFGQKVLQTLFEQRHSDRTNKSCNPTVKRQKTNNSQPSQHKKVLNFRDYNSYSSVNTVNHMLQSGYSLIGNTPPLQLIEGETENNDANKILDKQVKSGNYDLNIWPNDKTIINKYNNNKSKGYIKSSELHVAASLPVLGPSSVSDDVTWNDMFDSELFQHEPLQHKGITEKEESLPPYIESNAVTPLIIENNNITHDSSPKNKKNKENIDLTKCKNQLKVANDNNKVSQKCPNPKSSLRKEKYTKTVKNWLNNINKNCINETEIDKLSKGLSVKLAKKCKVKAKKRVVQAQLANKDGIMKYCKPKTNIEESKDKDNDTVVNTNTGSLKETAKKNNRTKFIAPIKSQIPVKDIKYNVVTIDNGNVDNYIELLNISNKIEVSVVIVYRNGFCQLNSNYTEDTCVPEGILMNLNEEFFYIKSFEGRIKTILSQILEHHTIVCFDGKNIFMYLSQFFKCRSPFIMDLKIGGALISPDNLPENFSDLQKLVSYTPQYTIATDCTLQKVAWYTFLLKECASKLKEILIEKTLWSTFVEVEMRLVPIIADMEARGVSIDSEQLKSMEEVLLAKMKCVEEQCHKAAGKSFQINSHAQVRALLYDELQLDAKNNVRVKETLTTGAKTTSETALRSLMCLHPLPKLILEYRHLHKAYATFLAGIAQHVKDGVVRPTWVQIAATGRIACNNPNLQAIPKSPFNLVMFPESNHSASAPLSLRSVYVCGLGRRLMAADFRQVECRIYALAARDHSLLALLHQDGDIFRALSAQWLKKSECEVSEAERERTKRVVYASLYGAGARKLADMLGQPYDQTLAILTSFNRTFPSLKSFGQRIITACEREEGVVRTLGGRARTIQHINSKDGAKRAHAQRQAVNYVVQGSAADLCKTAMILTDERLRLAIPAVDARLLMQIHDELVWEVAEGDLYRAADIIKEVMEGCGPHCGVPLRLPVAVTAGRRWAHMEPIHTHS